MSSEKEVYLEIDSITKGPYSWKEVMDMLKEKKIPWETLCYSKEDETWTSLQKLGGKLFEEDAESSETLTTRPIKVPTELISKKKNPPEDS